MKQLAGTIGKILFWIFAALVFFWTASLSLAALRTILPNDPIKPFIGLVLTDIGALTWLLVFIGQAQGLPQRAISLIMFIVDIAGVILLSAFELLTGGQNLAEVPAEMGNAVIWGVIGLTLANLAAAYFYHLAEPQTWKAIEFGVLTDRLQREALDQAQRNVEAEAQKLGAILAARATADLKYQLRLPMSDFEAAEHSKNLPASKQIVDAQATDQPAQPAGKIPWWKRNRKQQPPAPVDMAAAAMVTNEQTVIDVPELKPDPYGPEWKNSTDITPTLDGYAWVCKCEGTNPPHTKNCQWCGKPRTNGSPVTAFSNLPPAQEDASAKDASFPRAGG